MLLDWAARRRLKTELDADDSPAIQGQSGSIWEYSVARLGVSYRGTAGMWNRRRDQGCAIGMLCTQNGDEEGNLTFDPRDEEQSRLAIKVAGIKRRRKLTEAHKSKLGDSNRHNRFGTVLNAHSGR